MEEEINKKYKDLGDLAKEAEASTDKKTETKLDSRSNEIPKALPPQDQEPALSAPGQVVGNLMSLGNIFKESWKLYKTKFKDLLILSLIPLAIGSGVFLIMGVSGLTFTAVANQTTITSSAIAIAIIGVVLSGLINAVISLWMQVSTVMVLGDKGGWTVVLKPAFKKIWPLALVTILTGLATVGGMALLVIPGIIIAVYVSFATYVVILEDGSGLKALSASKAYVEGRWMGVFWRYLVMTVAAFVVGAVASGIPVLGSFVSLLIGPFVASYIYVVYVNAKQTARPSDEKTGNKALVVFIILGLLLGLGSIFFIQELWQFLKLLPSAEFQGAGTDFITNLP